MRHRKPRLRLVAPRPTAPPVFNVELPPGLPEGGEVNVRAITVRDSNHEPAIRPGDICVSWMGQPFRSGELGTVEAIDGSCYLGTLRHGPGGYVTLTTPACDGCPHTFGPEEYRRTGRVFSVERGGVVIQRF